MLRPAAAARPTWLWVVACESFCLTCRPRGVTSSSFSAGLPIGGAVEVAFAAWTLDWTLATSVDLSGSDAVHAHWFKSGSDCEASDIRRLCVCTTEGSDLRRCVNGASLLPKSALTRGVEVPAGGTFEHVDLSCNCVVNAANWQTSSVRVSRRLNISLWLCAETAGHVDSGAAKRIGEAGTEVVGAVHGGVCIEHTGVGCAICAIWLASTS